MIKSVIFDLGRVLIPFDFMRGYRRVSELTGLSVDEIRRRISASGLAPEYESGAFGEDEFVRRMQELLGLRLPQREFCEIWESVFLPETLVPEAMLEGIRARRRTVLLSNTNHTHFSFLKANYPILSHFDAYVLSHEVKAMKPSPKIFAAAVEASHCAPGECFFTDDVAEYVDAALAAGLDAVQFENCAQIQRELSARGVEW